MIQGIDRWRGVVSCACIAILLVTVGYPWTAFAAGASAWPVESTRILVRFEERYETDMVFTHRGIDVAARAGEPVYAPLSGEISFVGQVPAGEGQTRLAVSLRLADGRTLTFLPLDSLRVGEGDRVAAGDDLATVASGGDPSHPEVHLHVGLREGSAYRDPLSVLTPPAGAVQAQAVEAVAVVLAPPEPAAPPLSTALAPAPAVPYVDAVSAGSTAPAALRGASPLVPGPAAIPGGIEDYVPEPVSMRETHALPEPILAERMARLEGGVGAASTGSAITDIDAGAERVMHGGLFSRAREGMGVPVAFASRIMPFAIAFIAAPVAVSLTRADRRSVTGGDSQDEGVRPRGQTVAAATGR